MVDYVEFQDLAQELIAEFGRSVTLRRFTDVAPPDPNKPWVLGSPTITSSTVKAAFVPMNESPDQDHQLTDPGILSQMDESVCIVDALSSPIPPNLKDRILDGATEWVIERIGILKPGSLPIAYELRLKRG